MPEGDTLFRLARKAHAALAGRPLLELLAPAWSGELPSLHGAHVERAESHGKHLLLHVSTGFVVIVHLGMHGRARLVTEPLEVAPLVRRRDLSLALRVPELLLQVRAAREVRLVRARTLSLDPKLSALGPDPLRDDWDAEEACRRLRAQVGTPLGEALLDQRVLAGVGNVFKSELLFRQRLDPFALVRDCTDDELRALVLDAAVQLRRNVEGSGRVRITRDGPGARAEPLAVYERRGLPCFDCGAPVQRELQRDGRSTYYCARCQPERG